MGDQSGSHLPTAHYGVQSNGSRRGGGGCDNRATTSPSGRRNDATGYFDAVGGVDRIGCAVRCGARATRKEDEGGEAQG